MRTLQNRDGFALPMTILVIGFMTAGVLAAFARSGSEVRLVDNERAQLTAFAVAEAGLQQYFATTRGTPATTATYVFANDTAHVTAIRIRPAPTLNDPAIWLIRSEGRVRSGTRADLRTSRTVAQLAYLTTARMQVLSSWTSLSGLVKSGGAGVVSGDDACSGTVLPGVALPTGTYTQTSPGNVVQGNPPLQEMGTQADMATQIKIDWAGITNPANPSIPPDIIICGAGFDPAWGPCGAWPTSFPTGYWPTILVNGSLEPKLPVSPGRGTLIVTGDLVLGGGDDWEGIIMVGGAIDDNGSGDIDGAVVTGLNVLKGETVTPSSQADGVKDYTYDSCAVANALGNQSRMIGQQNAWVDNWTNW